MRPTIKRVVRRFVLLACVAVLVAPFAHTERTDEVPRRDASPRRAAVDRGPGPLLGVNYTHVEFAACEHGDGGVLAGRHEPEFRDRVREQLRLMRARGVESLRIVVWHMSDPGDHRWGVIASRGGRLGVRDRRNFRRLLSDIRAAGYLRLTLAFSPQWSNSPLRDNYDEGLLQENRSFIADVRADALLANLPEVRFDLLNEGGPSRHLPPASFDRMRRYVQQVWSWYVEEYGPWDATISSIGASDPRDVGDRLGNLVDALREAGPALPAWFDVHLNRPAEGAQRGFLAADAALTARGLDVPLVLGEVPYDDPAVAAALGEAAAVTGRVLDEVIQWYLRPGSECPVSPPYDIDAYRQLAA